MVEVKNGKIKKKSMAKKEGASSFPTAPADLPAPAVKDRAGIICFGIGGTGVVTIGALVGMAAHLEGKGLPGRQGRGGYGPRLRPRDGGGAGQLRPHADER